MIEAALYDHLRTDPAIAARVGDRIYPAPLPQDVTLPAVTYSRDGAIDTETLDDGQTAFTGAEIQVDAWADDYQQARQLAAEIHAALRNYRGMMGAVRVAAVFRQAEIDVYESSVGGYRRSQSYTLWHEE